MSDTFIKIEDTFKQHSPLTHFSEGTANETMKFLIKGNVKILKSFQGIQYKLSQCSPT